MYLSFICTSERSERAPQKYMYFQISKYICIHIQSMQWFGTLNDSSGVHTRTLNFEVILTTTVPKGIKPGVFVRVDNVAVIKLEDNCKF